MKVLEKCPTIKATLRKMNLVPACKMPQRPWVEAKQSIIGVSCATLGRSLEGSAEGKALRF